MPVRANDKDLQASLQYAFCFAEIVGISTLIVLLATTTNLVASFQLLCRFLAAINPQSVHMGIVERIKEAHKLVRLPILNGAPQGLRRSSLAFCGKNFTKFLDSHRILGG